MADTGSDTPVKLRLTPSPCYIRLISSDGHEFIVQVEVAFISPTIVAMMDGPALGCGECHFTKISSSVLSILVRYLNYKKHCPSIAWPDCSPPPPALDIPPHLLLDVTHAADFLGLVRHVGPSDYVRLKSSDGHVFIVKKEVALQSNTINELLEEIPLGSNGEVNYRELELDLVEPFTAWREVFLGWDEDDLVSPLEIISSRTLSSIANVLFFKKVHGTAFTRMFLYDIPPEPSLYYNWATVYFRVCQHVL